MLRSGARKKDWTLTKEAFERLLDSLDANRERAGEKYENVRRKLQATALNISLNALRLRACRIRTELGDCINTCVSHSKGDTETSISH